MWACLLAIVEICADNRFAECQLSESNCARICPFAASSAIFRSTPAGAGSASTVVMSSVSGIITFGACTITNSLDGYVCALKQFMHCTISSRGVFTANVNAVTNG